MDLKKQSAEHALSYVKDGMRLGLGSGSTMAFFIDLLGERLKDGQLGDIRVVPTSSAVARRAQELGIPLAGLDLHPVLDLAVDGADEVDPDLNLIKGLGRALLREKVVEIHARRFVVIVDDSKLVSRLGSRGPLPVEIVTFEHLAHIRWLNTLGCRAELWLEQDGRPVVTDNGNYLARCWFPGAGTASATGIPEVHAFARRLADRPGIVEHGLFLGMANQVIVAGTQGIQVLERSS